MVESDQRPDNDDPRRRYYLLSDRGCKVLSAEIRRLEGLVRIGRRLGLARQGEGS